MEKKITRESTVVYERHAVKYRFYSANFKQDHILKLPVVLYSSINSEKPTESSNEYDPSVCA
jgi:hypothetical protein